MTNSDNSLINPTRILAIATVFLAVGTIATGIFVGTQTTALIKQVDILQDDFEINNRPWIAGDQVRMTNNSLIYDVENFGKIPNESGERKILVVMTNASEGLTKEILSEMPGSKNSLMVIMPSQKISIILEEQIIQAIDESNELKMDLFLGIVLQYNYGDNKIGEYGYIGKYNTEDQYFDVIESWAD